MGLCENVYRRGGVYWWRRRMGLDDAKKPSYMRLSLRVREPKKARQLARLVGVEADRLRSVGMLSLAQQKDLLGRFIEQQVQHLDRYGALASHHDAANGATAEPLSDRVRRERIMAVVYSALGARGPAAELGNDDEGRLRSTGFSDEDIADISSTIAFLRDCVPRLHPDGGIGAAGSNGLVGPENIFFRQTLGEIGAEADNETVDQARRLWLQAASQAYSDVDRRHAQLNAAQAAALYQAYAGAPGPLLVVAATASASPQPAPAPAKASRPGVDYTISGQIKLMFETKGGDDWKFSMRGDLEICDSADQYAFVGKVLVKIVGKDDVRELDQTHVPEFLRYMRTLPLSYGKSPADWAMTLDEAIDKTKQKNKEIRQRAAEAAKIGRLTKEKEKPFGRASRTVWKNLTQLQSFIRFLRAGVGCSIDPDLITALKPNGESKERPSFPHDELRTLFSDEEWMGDVVVHDSTYWVPLFARYWGVREEEPCGLLIEDLELDRPIPIANIRNNWLRKLKTAERRLPIHPEALRLGFREYVEELRALGFKEVFPDLRARGTRTSLGDLFSKKFDQVLDRALPKAQSEGKVLHSLRKGGNMDMKNFDPPEEDSMCNQLLGHVPKGTNAKFYMDPLADHARLRAIMKITNVTSQIPARTINLSPLLAQDAEAKPKRKPRNRRRT